MINTLSKSPGTHFYASPSPHDQSPIQEIAIW